MSWLQTKLSEIAEINPKYVIGKTANLGQAVSFVPMASVSEQTFKIEDEQERLLKDVRKGFTPFKNDDVIIAKITPCFENGKVALVDIKHEIGFGSTEFHVLRANKKHLDPRYLYHFVRKDDIRFIGEKRMTGSAGQKRVPKVFWEQLKIPLPPLAEQQRIAAILDQADALRAKRRAALAKLDTLLQATFLEMFGDPVTNPMGWEVVELGELLNFVTSGSRGWAKYYSDQGTRFIRSLDVQMNHISNEDVVYVNAPETAEAKRTRVKPNDVLLTITGSRIGRVSTVPCSFEEGNISQHVAILRLNESKIYPRFVSMFLSLDKGGQRQIAQTAYGQTKPGLNFQQIKSFQLPYPPMEKQKIFLDFWDKFEIQVSKMKQSSTHLDNLFHSLQQRAFQGTL